jgi:dihydrodipicolinate synthase/N-acetylneuraminate lyase
MLARLRDEAGNIVGIKVSDSPWDAFSRYLIDGYDVLVGPEALIHRGMAAGAVGAISALAAALPSRVAAVVADPTEDGAAWLGELRASIERVPRHAALKRVLAREGVPISPDVRPPLRDLDAAELRLLDEWCAQAVA